MAKRALKKHMSKMLKAKFELMKQNMKYIDINNNIDISKVINDKDDINTMMNNSYISNNIINDNHINIMNNNVDIMNSNNNIINTNNNMIIYKDVMKINRRYYSHLCENDNKITIMNSNFNTMNHNIDLMDYNNDMIDGDIDIVDANRYIMCNYIAVMNTKEGNDTNDFDNIMNACNNVLNACNNVLIDCNNDMLTACINNNMVNEYNNIVNDDNNNMNDYNNIMNDLDNIITKSNITKSNITKNNYSRYNNVMNNNIMNNNRANSDKAAIGTDITRIYQLNFKTLLYAKIASTTLRPYLSNKVDLVRVAQYYLNLNFKRIRFFPFLRKNGRTEVFFNNSLGMVSKFFSKTKAFLRQKTSYLLSAAFLRKIMLYTGLRQLILKVRGVPLFLRDIVSTILNPGKKMYEHPFRSPTQIVDENIFTHGFTFSYVLFTNLKLHSLMKREKSRLKRKIAKK